MDNFDHFVKELAESGKHPFKKRYWFDFAKKAGFHAYIPGLKTILISAAGTLAVAGIGLGIYSASHHSDMPAYVPEAPETRPLPFSADTLQEPEVKENTDTVENAGPSVTVKPVRKPVKNNHTKLTTDSMNREIRTVPPEENTKEEKKYRWRILTIDPDTIKSNT